ncbi:MAG: 2-aminoethylphosphonate--pyruvate transaminase, partial [Rhizobiaceae bacterium]
MADQSNSLSNSPIEKPRLGEPFLLTPGPLTTAYSVKEQMLRDWGSWDGDFRAMTARLRSELLELIGDTNKEFDCVPMQGSGTFAVEAMLGSFLPKGSKTLVLSNGAYGSRTIQTLERIGRECVVINKGDYMPPRGEEVAAALKA